MRQFSASRPASPSSPPAFWLRSALILGLVLPLAPACRVHSGGGPPHISGTGLVRGHVALGIREEDQFLRFRASLSPDSLVEFSLWKLLRFDIGVVGASVGVGPIDVGLGVLFHDPYIPEMIEWGGGDDDEHPTESMDDEWMEDESADLDWNDEPNSGESTWLELENKSDKD